MHIIKPTLHQLAPPLAHTVNLSVTDSLRNFKVSKLLAHAATSNRIRGEQVDTTPSLKLYVSTKVGVIFIKRLAMTQLILCFLLIDAKYEAYIVAYPFLHVDIYLHIHNFLLLEQTLEE